MWTRRKHGSTRMLPFLVFALEHLELLIQMEKRVLMRRGVIVSDRLREPTLRLDAAYEQQVEEMVTHVVKLVAELPPTRAVQTSELSA